MVNWTTTSAQSVAHGVKMLVHAESGAGKTLLCATAPKPVIISAESGLLSLARSNIERTFGPNRPGITYDIPVMQVNTLQQFEEAYNFFANPGNHAGDHCHTICIDSLSEIAEQMLKHWKSAKRDPRQAYGEMADGMIDHVRKFRDLPGFHVYATAKQVAAKDEQTGTTRYTSSMPGKQLGPNLPYYFDEVFRLGVAADQGKVWRYLQTGMDMQYVAKDRSGALELYEQPDLTNIINKILGGNTHGR